MALTQHTPTLTHVNFGNFNVFNFLKKSWIIIWIILKSHSHVTAECQTAPLPLPQPLCTYLCFFLILEQCNSLEVNGLRHTHTHTLAPTSCWLILAHTHEYREISVNKHSIFMVFSLTPACFKPIIIVVIVSH
jgi:hypothetical protein